MKIKSWEVGARALLEENGKCWLSIKNCLASLHYILENPLSRGLYHRKNNEIWIGDFSARSCAFSITLCTYVVAVSCVLSYRPWLK